MAPWAGLLPPLLALVYAAWCGNLLGGVTAAGSSVAIALLLAVPALFLRSLDALRLGPGGRWWPPALWCAAALSAWRSPVPRAALEALALLPAYLVLPGALGRCWASAAARRLGARGMAAAVGGVAAWSLAGEPELAAAAAPLAVAPGGAPAAAPASLFALAPLGHHTLLAMWIAALLPLGLLPLRERGPWRWLGAAAGLAGAAAIVAGRSLAGAAALAGEALLAALLLAWRRAGGRAGGRPGLRSPAVWLFLAAVALAAAQAPRLLRVAGLHDPSARARWVYLQAGWAGWRERPWLGWGPGSVGWTAGWFLAPRPGLNPWGEAVGDLHSLPVHVAYEIGSAGLVCSLATVLAFALRRCAERSTASDRAWLGAGLLGLAGAGLAALSTATIAVAAVPWSIATAAAAALAGGARRTPEAAPTASAVPVPDTAKADGAAPADGGAPSRRASSDEPPPARRRSRWRLAGSSAAPWIGARAILRMYALATAAVLLAPQAARFHYDRAVRAGQEGRQGEAAAEMRTAARLDPAMPLYPLRLAFLESGGGGTPSSGEPPLPTGPPHAALDALQAARGARGVGLLWLAAGVLGRASGEMWSAAALEQACVQDPLGPYAPFYLMALRPAGPAAPRLGARALLAEPRLAAATFWEGREDLFRAALEQVRRWPGLDAGWKLALLRSAPQPAARRGAASRLALTIDAAGFNRSTSLHLFQRLPWPTLWPLVVVREDLLPALAMPSAVTLTSTGASPFEAGRCDPELTSAH